MQQFAGCDSRYPNVKGGEAGRGISFVAGIATFAELEAFCSPRGNLNMEFTAVVQIPKFVDAEDMTSAATYSILATSTRLHFRDCLVGETQVESVCQLCPYGTYNVNPNELGCTDCKNVEGIEKCYASTIVLLPGYWRQTSTSTNIYTCPAVGNGCDGGNSTGTCQSGFTGPLCSYCAEDFFFDGSTCLSCEDAGTATNTSSNWLI